ncbi:hypothetical protein IGI04_004389 [Brassica rapa subsp. trilocularis]|uniref:Enhancer of polycomb-like protein n=1 Tax=Brassica rapa subsp. trilocularis TaxID=1813537 RepID=A0ABQ7NDC7_BRACM|nr:hypothetical protein IGI04_004389 [Brassica rapa subsp. trilocularis]
MGMRRTTRVLDGAARVLRSGRRISHNVDEPKAKRAKGKGNNKGEDFTANKRRKVSSEAVDKRFGIVYNRKRKTLSNQSSGSSSNRPVKPPQSLKFYTRRRRRLLCVPVITLRVDWSCKDCWLSTVFGLVMRYLTRKEQLSALASFFLSQPVNDAFADHGVRFLSEPPLSSSRGVCRFFGGVNRLPLLSVDFSAVPGCFMDLHLTLALRVAPRSFAFVGRYLYLMNNPVEECDSEAELVLSPPCSPRNNGLHPLTVGNAQCRSSLGFDNIQRGRRSSLRKRRGGRNITHSVHKYNVVTQQNVKVIPIPGVREVCGYADDDSPSFSMPVHYISVKEDEVSRAMARSSAIYEMDSDDEEWLRKQNVEVFGKEDEEVLERDAFELMIDGFEKRCFHSLGDDLVDEKATVVARQEVVEAVHDYWLRKRKKRKAPLLRVFQGRRQAKKTPRPSKTVFRKRRSFKRQGKGKQLHLDLMVEKLLSRKSLDIDDLSCITWTVALKMAEQEAWEEQEAFRRVEEAKAYADATMEIAIASRSRAQVLGENADLAVYKATMALKIAEAKKAAEPIELARNLFLN